MLFRSDVRLVKKHLSALEFFVDDIPRFKKYLEKNFPKNSEKTNHFRNHILRLVSSRLEAKLIFDIETKMIGITKNIIQTEKRVSECHKFRETALTLYHNILIDQIWFSNTIRATPLVPKSQSSSS